MRCSIRSYPFSNTLCTLSTVWSRVGLHPRKFFSSSNRTNGKIKWTDELDCKVLELSQQGLSMRQIAQQLGVGLSSIWHRMSKVRAKSESGPAPFSTGKFWSASEDKVLMDKIEAGLKWEQILPFLHGRSVAAVQSRYYKLKLQRGNAGAARRANEGKPWTAEERQRVISMILAEGLSQAVTAERLGRTKAAVNFIWQKHGRNVLPAEMTEKVRREREWTSEQDNILIEQKKKGNSYKAIRCMLPSKSVRAMYGRAQVLQITPMRLSPAQKAAVRKDLQAVPSGSAKHKDVHDK